MDDVSRQEQLANARLAELERAHPDWSAADLDKAGRVEAWLWPRLAAVLPEGHDAVTVVCFGMSPPQFPARSKQLCLVASRAAVSTFTFNLLLRTVREYVTVSLPVRDIGRRTAMLDTAILDVRGAAGNWLRFESGRPDIEHIAAYLAQQSALLR